ncbi:sigma-54 dependent transcriptional regulator [Desulfovibrio sp. OttesenSCG-928-C14]|nr:sigma-54 dependent transcriptional regulator [Desulfovibrio sp. OttesenSCG-928-C14]
MEEKNKNRKILVVDDEEGIRFSLRGILEDEGYQVWEAGSGEEGLALIETQEVDLVFLDIWLPGMAGPEVLEKLRARLPNLPVLMISGHATIEDAVQAIKNGAHDFIEKPLSLEKVLIAVARALEYKELQRENTDLQRENLVLKSTLPSCGPEDILGESQSMQALRRLMDMVAPMDTWVLLTGENGTGKEIAARYIHGHSQRAGKPMVAVNCAAIPEELIESELFGHEKGAFTGAESAKTGKFELAHQGTLFLDEIGDMSVKTQAKILRILQEQSFERVGGNRSIKVDVRVIAATNKNLEQAIERGDFREDLYYRLRVFPLHLPPLRERGSDVLLLLDHFNTRFQQDYRLSPASFDAGAKAALLRYRWPGNVREARNFTERMLIMYGGQEISAQMLPPEILNPKNFRNEESTLEEAQARPGAPGRAAQAEANLPPALESNDFKGARNAFEVLYLETKLREFGGNISKMAEAIGLERSYLHRKLKSMGITD